MTKIRTFMFAAAAAVVAFGVSGQQALAVDPHFKIVNVGPVGSHTPDVDKAASQVHQLLTNMGVAAPADASGNDTWPCFTGGSDPDCSSITGGGLVIGIPFYTWNLTSCTSSSAACGQIYWEFETDVASTKSDILITLNVKQGSTLIYSTGSTPINVGANPGKGYVEVISGNVAFGPGDCGDLTCGTPVAGAATITTTTKIGTSTATGTAHILLSATGGA